MNRIAAVFGAALLASACNPPVPAAAPTPEEGRYVYAGRYLAPGGAQPHEFRGYLVLTETSRERVTGRWEVIGFDQDLQLGAFVNGAYDVGAVVDHQGLRGEFKHRLTRGQDGAWTCTAVFVARMDGAPVSNPATCSLTRPAS